MAHPGKRYQRHLTSGRSLLAGSSESLVLALRFHIEAAGTVHTIERHLLTFFDFTEGEDILHHPVVPAEACV